jgi:hypothetical protein
MLAAARARIVARCTPDSDRPKAIARSVSPRLATGKKPVIGSIRPQGAAREVGIYKRRAYCWSLEADVPAALPPRAPWEPSHRATSSSVLVNRQCTGETGRVISLIIGEPHLFTSGLVSTADFSRTRMTVAPFSARCGSDFCDALWVSRMVRWGRRRPRLSRSCGTDGRGEMPDESGLWASGSEGEANA